MHAATDLETLFRTIKPKLEECSLFAAVRIELELNRICCDALASAELAFYSIQRDDPSSLYVALQTPARYLSQSIEADLMFTGDKLEDLLHEELVDQGYDAATPHHFWKVEHFRSEAKLYTFRSLLPVAPASWATQPTAELAVIALKAYEAVFRPLGDMEADDE